VGELVDKGLAQAEREHDRLSLVGLLRVRAQWQAQQRAWPEAHADIERCLAVFATMPFPYAEAQILETWGRIWWDEGKRDEGRKWLSRALELYDGLGAAGGARRVRSLLSEE
jgi:hypothetical protein